MKNNQAPSKFRRLLILAIVLVASLFGTNVDTLFPARNENSVVESQQEQDDYNMEETEQEDADEEVQYTFKSNSNWISHFEKHGEEFDYVTKEEYLEGANRVIANKNSLHKLEKEDGDDVYYLEETNEFVIVSTDGYLRTYFKPSAGKKYYDRQ